MSRILSSSLSKQEARNVAVAVGGEGGQGGSSEPGRNDHDYHDDVHDDDHDVGHDDCNDF